MSSDAPDGWREVLDDMIRVFEQAPSRPARTPRDELRELLAESEPWGGATRYIRGELAVPPPERDVAVAKVEALAYPLYAQDAAAVLGLVDAVGVHIGWRWANVGTRWEVCLLDRETGEQAGPWVAVPPRTQTRD